MRDAMQLFAEFYFQAKLLPALRLKTFFARFFGTYKTAILMKYIWNFLTILNHRAKDQQLQRRKLGSHWDNFEFPQCKHNQVKFAVKNFPLAHLALKALSE